MRFRLFAPGLALAAVLADAIGVHGLASWLVLIALPAAATAAFVAVSDALDRGPRLPALTASGALLLLVAGSAVREGAPRGAHVPALAVSTIVLALVCYAVPAVTWLFTEPLRSLRTATPTRRAARA
jgi:hypothetical protein